MLIHDDWYLDEPGTILEGFQNINRAEEFRPILGGVAERLERPGIDEGRDVIRLAVQDPPLDATG